MIIFSCAMAICMSSLEKCLLRYSARFVVVVVVVVCFLFFAALHGWWDLSSLTRDQTWALSSESAES